MKKTTFYPEKMIATQTIGSYEVKLRSMAYWDNGHNDPVYALTVWRDWKLLDTTKWNTWEVARHQFDEAKRKCAVKLAEDVLFNQEEPRI